MANTLCHRLCVGCLFLCTLFGQVARAQDNTLSLSIGYRQMQETLNQSFIFRGPSLSLNYRRTVFSDTIVHINYSPDLSFSGMFSHRMPAYSLSFRPVDFACTCPVFTSPAWDLRLGGSVWAYYDWRIYPAQHASQLFAYGEYTLAFRADVSCRTPKHLFNLSWSNSLLGFTSLTDTYADWFYSFRFRDFLAEPHRNLRFGSFERYDHTRIALTWQPEALHGNAFAVECNYILCRTQSIVYQSLVLNAVWRKSF